MIYGTGVDLVSIVRMEGVIRRWGDRFLGRIFRPEEIRVCGARPLPHQAFALRFGAKEAFSKALGLGMRKGLRWRDIEVFNNPAGKPGLRLHGRAAEICRDRGIDGVHLSLSDDGEYGVAMVVLEVMERGEDSIPERGGKRC
ncbi:MAG: holo-ACP synthase [Deltaproteobacteria bacterium]|nr:holo-ACP synthase [Deltaproteobacteria bacterium]MBW2047900.1 holo-ACP synthase [Deltaproteobacteria bacterium]MBW2110282.1 holo-ACP synthase [Deltaproteobacteria bacterium]MBW2352059.1 holo-ACP synthase [Deltaproteobacteria bacterium]HDZ91304.1 holo-[acyl-carrier-protein] synthase [Deltaproteobacteria bacterium]